MRTRGSETSARPAHARPVPAAHCRCAAGCRSRTSESGGRFRPDCLPPVPALAGARLMLRRVTPTSFLASSSVAVTCTGWSPGFCQGATMASDRTSSGDAGAGAASPVKKTSTSSF